MSHALDGTHVDSQGPAQRIALVRAEQRREWQAGRRVLAEAYLARSPELAADADAVVNLAASEFELRTDLGDAPVIEEYLQRFPEHATALRRRLTAIDSVAEQSQAET
ncbi:MAG TPA: hypothetical protein VH120_16050, partial [Gemmataceae bacterium]|nr:hypothetical protein [Gemmataceae bacterium]